jgi:hypothetical protein
LYGDAFDRVDYYEGAICDAESGSDFRAEIDVSRRIDKVDEKLISICWLLDLYVFDIFI